MGILVIDIHRTLIVSDSITEIGVEGYALLSYISFRQDELRMLKKPRFFQKELMNFIGIYDERTFRKIRKKCIDSGWLTYEQRGTREAGEYEVSLPKYLCETSKDEEQKRLGSFDAPNSAPNDAPNHVPNDAPYSVPNHVPNDAPYSVPNHVPNDAPNHAPLSIPNPIPNPNPNPKNIINSVDSGESTEQEISPAKAKRDSNAKKYSEEFENFWTTTKYPVRQQDAKGEMAKKFGQLRAKGLSASDIEFACNRYAEMNRDNEYTLGLRRFLAIENVQQYLKSAMPQVENKIIPMKDLPLDQRNRMVADRVRASLQAEAEAEESTNNPKLLSECF